jgi:DNA-binding cell septation regulator SpoVG
MNSNGLKVEIRSATKSGPVKAYADVRIEVPNGELTICGFSIIQKDGKPCFVGFPSKPGNIQGKYFPIFEAEGQIREAICKAVLEAYGQTGTRQ